MHFDNSSWPRLKTCIAVGCAAGCVVYAGVLLRRHVRKPGPPPVVTCPFADNTVALLRDLHDGPFRFGDPTPVAAAARREAMRRLRRQQAHRRHLRRKMRVLLLRSQYATHSAQQQQKEGTAKDEKASTRQQHSRRSTMRPLSVTTNPLAGADEGGLIAVDEHPLPLDLGQNIHADSAQRAAASGAASSTFSASSRADGSDYAGRFAEEHRRLRRRSLQRSAGHKTVTVDASANSTSTFVKHARAMLSSPVDGVLGATRSAASSFTPSEGWDLSDTDRRHRTGSTASSHSSRLSSATCSSETTTTSTLTSTSSSYYTSSVSSRSDAASSVAGSSSSALNNDDATSAATAESLATQEKVGWNSVDFSAAFEGGHRSSSSLSHPTGDPAQHSCSYRRFSASGSHVPSAMASAASPYPQSSPGGGAAVAAVPAADHSHTTHSSLRHSLGQPPPQLPGGFESTTTTPAASSHHYGSHHNHHQHQHHHRSASHSGVYTRSGSYSEVALAAAAATMAAGRSSVGGDGDDSYGYPVSAALYGPPLFATEMDVTDALAELRSSTRYTTDGHNGSVLGNHHSGSNGNLGGLLGGGGGGASLFGGALTLASVGQVLPSPPPFQSNTVASSQAGGGSSSCYASNAASHFSGSPNNASAAGPLAAPHRGTYGTHYSHHYTNNNSISRSQQPQQHHHHHHGRSSSSGGGGATYRRVSSRTSQRQSHTNSPSNSQLMPVYTSLPGPGGPSSQLTPPFPSSPQPSGSTAVPLSRLSSLMRNSLATPGQSMPLANSFRSVTSGYRVSGHGATAAAHRRHAYRLRKWWRRTRRHLRRRLHDWRSATGLRVAAVASVLKSACVSARQACAQGASYTALAAKTCVASLQSCAAGCVHRVVRRLFYRSGGGAAREVDPSVLMSRRVNADGAGSAAATAAAASTPTKPTAADLKRAELKEQESLDATSMEEAINKVVEMLAPSPGRVPTVVVIRAPLGYDVSTDAESLWKALNLDSVSFEEGLVDVVMMEELKTEPLPPAPQQQPPANAASQSRPGSVPLEDDDGGRGSAGRQLPHPLSLDSAGDVGYEQQQQRDSAVRPSAVPTPPPARPLRRSSPPPAAEADRRKGEMRVSFELYPAHIFYSSIIRAAILQEKDLALRRAAAELYGGSADLEGLNSGGYGGDSTGYSAAAAGGGAGGGCGGGGSALFNTPGSPLPLTRAASTSVFNTHQRSANNSRCGPGSYSGGGSSMGAHNVVNSVENFCLTPIAPGHFVRSSLSPKLPGMHHSHSAPGPTLSAGGGVTGSGQAVLSHALNSGPPLLPLPPPSIPLGPSAGVSWPATTQLNGATAQSAGVAETNGVAAPATFPSPTFAPAVPGAGPNVVVRLSASYSCPALPPQMVLSPLHSPHGNSHMLGGGPSLPSGLSLGSNAMLAHGFAPVINTSAGVGGAGGGGGGGASMSSANNTTARRLNAERYSAAHRFVSRSEVLLYIHVLRTPVSDPAMRNGLPSCVMSDFGDDDAAAMSRSGPVTANASTHQQGTPHGGGVEAMRTTSPSASVRTAEPRSATIAPRDGRGGGDAFDRADPSTTARRSGSVQVSRDDNDEEDGSLSEQAEEAQTLLELRQREVEAPVLLRYRLRISHQGSRSLEALKRTEKYAQDHVPIWQEEAKKMLQAMPPTEAAAVVGSAVASGHRLSSLSTPSLMMTSSPLLRPADSASARLPPPVGGYPPAMTQAQHQSGGPGPRSIHRSGSRYAGLPMLSVSTAPLASNQELDKEEDRETGPLHLPAWAMEVLIRRESMRETLIRDLKEKAFRVCAIPLPDMRVHCLLPPAVPRYAAAHARGFPLSRTFAEEVLSQQRTLQYILLQKEQENQRVIAAQIRRARRRQERHEQRRRERRAREEERQRQRAARATTGSFRTKLQNSMRSPAALVSRMASMVKISRSREALALSSTGKESMDAIVLAATSVSTQATTVRTAGSPSASVHEVVRSDARSAPLPPRRHGQPAPGDTSISPSPTPHLALATTLSAAVAAASDDGGGGQARTSAASWTVGANTMSTTVDSDAGPLDGGSPSRLGAAAAQRPRPSPPPQQQQRRQRGGSWEPTAHSPTEADVHFLGGSSQNSMASETPQEPGLTMILPIMTAPTTTNSNASAGSYPEACSGPVSTTMLAPVSAPNPRSSSHGKSLNSTSHQGSNSTTSGDQIPLGQSWTGPSAPPAPLSAPPSTSLTMVAAPSISARSSPALSPLRSRDLAAASSSLGAAPALQSLSPLAGMAASGSGGGTGEPPAASASGAGAAATCTTPLSSLVAMRSSNWTAVHTATNANTSVSPPPPLMPAGAGEAYTGMYGNTQHTTSSTLNLSALAEEAAEADVEGEEEAGGGASSGGRTAPETTGAAVPSTGGACKPRGSPASSPLGGKPGGGGGGSSTSLRAPLGAVETPYSASAHPRDGAAAATTLLHPESPHASTALMTGRMMNVSTADTLDLAPSAHAATRICSLETGVTPPVLYFTRPQSVVAMTTSTSSRLAAQSSPQHTALLVPVPHHPYYRSASDSGHLLQSQTSYTRSPPMTDGLPASSTTSTIPAVPNNSMYGTFDAYYGHSAATPQAVLLRQQAQAAAVAGLTSESNSPSSSLPSHLRRSPMPSSSGQTAATAAGGGAALTGVSSSMPSSHESRTTSAMAVGGGAAHGLRRSPNPPPSTSSAAAAPPTAAAAVPQVSAHHLQVPRASVTDGRGSSGPRRTSSGLLPYTYSADSVSSMYGTAHYPLYQYPDDPAAYAGGQEGATNGGGGGGSPGVAAAAAAANSPQTAATAMAFAATGPPPSSSPYPYGGGGAGLPKPASMTGIYASPTAVSGALSGSYGDAAGRTAEGWGPAGVPRVADSPVQAAEGGVAQDTHMNRLKQYNKLLSDLLGVAGGPMRSGISFYYTYGDATALLYNASIQVPSDEDILELLEQQQWAPDPAQLTVDWNGPLGDGSAATTKGHGLDVPIVTRSAGSSSGSGTVYGPPSPEDSVAAAALPSPNPESSAGGSGAAAAASKVPPSLLGIGDSPPGTRGDGGSGPAGQGSSASNSGQRDGGAALPEVRGEEEGCSYLDYSDLPYPEDSMDALEAEQIDAQRTRNKNFYSIFEHLHRAYHDAVLAPVEQGMSRAQSPYTPGPATGTAAARQSPPPLGGFTTTASFSGLPGSPHSPGAAARGASWGPLSAPHRMYAYTCRLVRWLGWKLGLAAAPPPALHRSGSGDDVADLAYCGVHSPPSALRSGSSPHLSGSGSDGDAFTSPSYAAEEEQNAEKLARRFPGERIVTFGREWRVASQMDMHNGHFGLSPLQVWMAARYSRRFAGEVYLMDVVAAGSDPFYPAVRVLDEVVAHAVLYYHNHSLRDFTEDLASELGLEYVPQTAWGRRALGLPINETAVQQLDGLLYTATRRRQDRRRRAQEEKRRQQREQRKARTHRGAGGAAARGTRPARSGAAPQPTTGGAGSRSTAATRADSATTAAQRRTSLTALGDDAFVAFGFADDVDRPSSTTKAATSRAVPPSLETEQLSAGANSLPPSLPSVSASTPNAGAAAAAAATAAERSRRVDSTAEEEEGEDDREAMRRERRSFAVSSIDNTTATAGGGGAGGSGSGRTSRLLQAASGSNLVTPLLHRVSPTTAVPVGSAATKRGRCSSSSDVDGEGTRVDPFAGVDETLWLEMQSYDQEEDEEVFYGATAAAVVGIGSGDINMAPHIYDAVMEREVYDERMLLRELDHLKDFLIENRNVLSSAMLTTTGSNALEAVFGVPATVFPFLLCARESVPLISSIFESLSYHYGALTYDNFSKMTSDAFGADRPDVLRHTPRLFRMVNKSRRGCVTYEELCGWLARKLSCGNNVQPNAHLLAAIMSLRLPLALVAESREEWSNYRCALKSLSDADEEEY